MGPNFTVPHPVYQWPPRPQIAGRSLPTDQAGVRPKKQSFREKQTGVRVALLKPGRFWFVCLHREIETVSKYRRGWPVANSADAFSSLS